MNATAWKGRPTHVLKTDTVLAMTDETQSPSDRPAIDELEGPLRQAVEQIRRQPVPEETLRRALSRLEGLETQGPVNRGKSNGRNNADRRVPRLIFVTAMLSVGAIGLIVVFAQFATQERSAARWFPSRSNVTQIGLAMQGSRRINLMGGTDLIYVPEAANAVAAAIAIREAAGQQRIIYTAEVSLVVEDISAAQAQVAELVRRFRGYVADSRLNEAEGQQRTGWWVVRVPVDSFDEAVEAVMQLGIPENRQSKAQDVTEEYVDLESRIAGKQQLEKRILKLLDERTGDIEDVIAVEKQLSRVREEIEQAQGRLKYLQNRTALATLTISAREERDYVPPQAPSFSSQIRQTWSGSLDALQQFGKASLIVTVAVAPWLPVFAVLYFTITWLLKRRKKPSRG
jgi:hypothetical protein